MMQAFDLSKHYPAPGRRGGVVRAVDGVSLRIGAGESVGLVGESGSGKSTIGQMLLLQTRPTAGRIEFEGKEVRTGDRASAQALRGRVQVVFQDPYDSLNPRLRVREIVAEPLRNLGTLDARALNARVEAVVQRVGLRVEDLSKYPHQFSGGQRQRIGIARALSVDPSFLVLDEPVSALDVSVQAQVVNLLSDLREQHRIGVLFISHNLAIVEHLCERVLILYLGRVVESLPTAALHGPRLHPYTRALIDAVPVPDPARVRTVAPLPGEIPDPANLPSGCRFASRCPMVEARCREREPEWQEVAPGHGMACHRSAELAP